MSNRTIDIFFSNYRLLPDWQAFAGAQRKLLAKDVVIISHDHRGDRVGAGLNAYIEEVRDAALTFEATGDRRMEIFDASPDQITVRIRGTVRLRSPLGSISEFADDRHLWTETFRFDADGKISQLEGRMTFKTGAPAESGAG
jgi:hypothetical protein